LTSTLTRTTVSLFLDQISTLSFEYFLFDLEIYSFIGAEKQADQLTAGYLTCAGLTQVNLPALCTNFMETGPGDGKLKIFLKICTYLIIYHRFFVESRFSKLLFSQERD
jgi:hypothetical protein